MNGQQHGGARATNYKQCQPRILPILNKDEAAKAAAMERLKEFGPQFAGPFEFSPQLSATATVGLLGNFGIVPVKLTSQANPPSLDS